MATIANTGVSSAYAIVTQTINITLLCLEDIRVRAYNMNGTSSYATVSTKVAVHTAINGVTEEDINVNNSLGDGTYVDNGKEFLILQVTVIHPFTSPTNFYTNNLFTGNKL